MSEEFTRLGSQQSPVAGGSGVPLPHVVPSIENRALPPILLGTAPPAVERRVGEFYNSVAAIFETWVSRRESAHTRRAYRQDVITFVRFMGYRSPGHEVGAGFRRDGPDDRARWQGREQGFSPVGVRSKPKRDRNRRSLLADLCDGQSVASVAA